MKSSNVTPAAPSSWRVSGMWERSSSAMSSAVTSRMLGGAWAAAGTTWAGEEAAPVTAFAARRHRDE